MIINDDNFYEKYHEPDLRLQKALEVHTRIDKNSRIIVAVPEKRIRTSENQFTFMVGKSLLIIIHDCFLQGSLWQRYCGAEM